MPIFVAIRPWLSDADCLQPKVFFLTMVHLVSGGKAGGYFTALLKAFTLDQDKASPSASAFSQMRAKISYRFFLAAFERLVVRCQSRRRLWKELQVVAIDGMQLTLPRSKDVMKRMFSGRKTSQYSESYMPKGFMTLAFDVLSGVILKKTFHPLLNEIADAVSMISSFPKRTLFVYDRLYFCKKLLSAHRQHGSFFVARLKRNAHKKVMSFFSSKRRFTVVRIDGVTVYLVKVKTPKGTNIFATNLRRGLFTNEEIAQIYKLRWQVETAFFDLSTSCHLEAWHAKSLNGILQELYLRLWLFNATRLLSGACQEFASVGMSDYKRANFRVLLTYVAGALARHWCDFAKLLPRVQTLIKDTSQRRTVNKRDNPRVIKSPRSPYKYRSTEWQWDKSYA